MMVRNGKLWDEITARIAELVDRDGIEFLPTLSGLQAQIFVEVEIGPEGRAELHVRNNSLVDNAGAPVMATVEVSRALHQRLVREKETAVQSLLKCHGQANWDRLVARSRPVEADGHLDILGAGAVKA